MVSWLKDDERQQPLTDEQRIAVEKQLKIQLPEELIALFKQQNGGYIEGLACPTAEPTSWADDHIQIDHFFEISEESGLVDSPYLCSEWGLRKKLVIFSGDGYGWFALDYKRKKNGPRVVYIDSELEEEQELAPSFAVFLSKLVPAEEYVIEKEDEGIALENTKENRAFIAEQLRKGRTNEQLLAKINAVLAENNAKKIKKCFNDIISLEDESLEMYLIDRLVHHENTSIRGDVVGYLSAYLPAFEGDKHVNDTLSLYYVNQTMEKLKQDKSAKVKPFVAYWFQEYKM